MRTGGKAVARALLVEANSRLSKALKHGLESAGFVVDLAGDGVEADAKMQGASYDVVVVDLLLPKIDGLILLRQWRRAGVQSKFLVLKAKDKSAGQRNGTDVSDTILRVHDLEIDGAARTVKRAGQPIHLTPREFSLLQYLASHPGKVVTRAMLRGHFYDAYDEADEKPSNVVDVYIRYLRKKIDKGFPKPLILTRWGHGYLLRSDED